MEELTPRERDVVRLLAGGLSNSEIALELGVSYATVRNHLTSVYDKAGLRSRIEVAVWALQVGIVRLDEIELRRI